MIRRSVQFGDGFVVANLVTPAPADHVAVAPEMDRRLAEVGAVEVSRLLVVCGQIRFLRRENRNVVQVGAEDIRTEVPVFAGVQDEVVPQPVDLFADHDAVARIALENSQGEEPLHLHGHLFERGFASGKVNGHALLGPREIEGIDQRELREQSRRNSSRCGAGKDDTLHQSVPFKEHSP